MELKANNLSKSFGGIRAVDDISFTLHGGKTVCITGANGAGKTTLFNLLTGYVLPDSGSIFLNDRDITRLSTPARARLGMARTFQNIRLPAEMTACETLICAMHNRFTHPLADEFFPHLLGKKHLREITAEARELLAALGLGEFSDMKTALLPYGARKSLELARALARRPSLLLLDEPSSGLNTPEAAEFADLLTGKVRQMLAPDTLILVIEHNMDVVNRIADDVMRIEGGRLTRKEEP